MRLTVLSIAAGAILVALLQCDTPYFYLSANDGLNIVPQQTNINLSQLKIPDGGTSPTADIPYSVIGFHNSRPAESALVIVTAQSTPCRYLGSSVPTSTGITFTLSPSGSSGACEKISDTSLRCTLLPDGTAAFSATLAFVAQQQTDGIGPFLCAVSGSAVQEAVTSIQPGIPPDAGIVIEGESAIPAGHGNVTCGPGQSASCDAIARSLPLTIAIFDPQGVGLQSSHLIGQLYLGPSAPFPDVWLSKNSGCEPGIKDLMEVTGIGSSPVALCANGRGQPDGGVTLSASLVGNALQLLATKTVTVSQQPTRISATTSGVGTQADPMFASIIVTDCANIPIAGFPLSVSGDGLSIDLPDGGESATGPDGVLTVTVVSPSGMPPSTINVALPTGDTCAIGL